MITKDEQGELKFYGSRIWELQTCKSPTVDGFCKQKLGSSKGPLGRNIASVWKRKTSRTSPKLQSLPRRSESIRSDVLCPLFLLICFTEFILLIFIYFVKLYIYFKFRLWLYLNKTFWLFFWYSRKAEWLQQYFLIPSIYNEDFSSHFFNLLSWLQLFVRGEFSIRSVFLND